MNRFMVGDFAEAGALMVVGSLSPDDPRIGELMTACFDFPLHVRTVVLCDSLGPGKAETILGALLYSQSSVDLEELGPGQFEPLGAVEFNFKTANIQTYVLRDEPMLKSFIDGKRRAGREKHAK